MKKASIPCLRNKSLATLATRTLQGFDEMIGQIEM